ncbi:MAG: hypothetical protein JW929_12580 [Anaerolineales bacterium]|nr:hypothetical protein [Anaerolineales bacterium]
MRIVWVEDAYRVGDDPRGEYVPGGGAVARLRVLRRDGADLAFVEGNIHAWGMPPLWFEYLVQKKAGFWMVKSCYHRWMS